MFKMCALSLGQPAQVVNILHGHSYYSNNYVEKAQIQMIFVIRPADE
jgi:hypothetical protein